MARLINPEEGQDEEQNRHLDLAEGFFSEAIGLSREQFAAQQIISQKLADVAERQQVIAEERWNRFKETYTPLEEAVVSESMRGLSGAYEADIAGAEVRDAYNRSEQMTRRRLSSYGIDPSSPRFASIMQNLDQAAAAAEAGARTSARRTVKDINYNRKVAGLSLGMCIPNQAAQILGSTAGTLGQSSAAQATGLQGFNNIVSSYGGYAGNLYNTDTQFKLGQLDAETRKEVSDDQTTQSVISSIGTALGSL